LQVAPLSAFGVHVVSLYGSQEIVGGVGLATFHTK
jgi:hypothetical protein